MSPEQAVQLVPAPWKLKGRTWIFFLPYQFNASSTSGHQFPPGWSVEWQADVLAEGGEFIGGPSFVQLVSYTESEAGPYDELVYVPGWWKYKDGTTAFRVTRIYVSTTASVMNGRLNWNVPKELASFSYKQDPKTSVWSLQVSKANSSPSTEPFFSATFSPIPVASSIPIPVNSTMLGKYYTIIQPPIPRGPDADEDATVASTPEWAVLTPVLKGWGYAGSVQRTLRSNTEGKKALADGVNFPDVVPSLVGMYVEDMTLDFGLSTWRKNPNDGFEPRV